jgi:hypothetical protein
MELNKVKDLKLYFKRHKYLFIYFYDDWCSNKTLEIDEFFKTKYDLNKLYIKIKVSNSKKLVNEMALTVYPTLRIYNKEELISEISCNIDNLKDKINEIYNFIK